MTVRYIVGDVFEELAKLGPQSVDLVVTSPPFLALRSYLPADHPDKPKEIGSEKTPGEFLDVLLDVVEACDRVLAPHGSLVFELGDTYSGNGESGWERDKGEYRRETRSANSAAGILQGTRQTAGWPLDKSKVLVPQLFAIALAYGTNPLTGRQTPPWRIRNTVAWCLDGDTVVYARTPKGEGPTRLLHLTQNWQPGQWELWDGDRWTPVLGWSATEAADAIEIEFRNGERVSATREHEWPTQRGLVRTEDLTVGDIVPRVRLPEPERIEPDHLPAEDIGWFVGTFLADGSFDSRDRIQIAGHTDEGPLRLARLRRLAEAFDGTATSHDYGNEGNVVVRSDILAAVLRRYLGGTDARTKRLRAAAWRRGDDFLWAVLTGYLEGDGHYEEKNGRWRVGFTDNPWLARDLRVLCARIGVSCRIKRVARAADPRGGQFAKTAPFMHHGSIRLEPNPRARDDGEIVALRASKRRRFFDVGVAGEPHLFALGSGLLTHNCRPNPPVGRDGDKFRCATSFLTVATKARDRYWDGDAVRTPYKPVGRQDPEKAMGKRIGGSVDAYPDDVRSGWTNNGGTIREDRGGAPLLDWWEIPTHPYKGAHYATWPPALVVPLIKSMCPLKVCRVCGEPSRRIVETERVTDGNYDRLSSTVRSQGASVGPFASNGDTERRTLGWSDCGHNQWRPGHCLDPFAGSGTTGLVASGHGMDCTLIDLDRRNAGLAVERIGGLFVEVIDHTSAPARDVVP